MSRRLMVGMYVVAVLSAIALLCRMPTGITDVNTQPDVSVGIGPDEGLPEGHFLRVDTDNTQAGDSALGLTDWDSSHQRYTADRDKRVAVEVRRGLVNPYNTIGDVNIETAQGLLVGKNRIGFPATATRIEGYIGFSWNTVPSSKPSTHLELIAGGKSFTVPIGKDFAMRVPPVKEVTVVAPLDEYSYHLGELRAYK